MAGRGGVGRRVQVVVCSVACSAGYVRLVVAVLVVVPLALCVRGPGRAGAVFLRRLLGTFLLLLLTIRPGMPRRWVTGISALFED